ncbi:MAG: hypothetical protein ACRC3B_02670, partial [Bacteroidia bacterium]
MKYFYKHLFICIIFLFAVLTRVNAQPPAFPEPMPYNPSIINGTYQPITGGEFVGVSISTPCNIGFSFGYDSIMFTRFWIDANGYIELTNNTYPRFGNYPSPFGPSNVSLGYIISAFSDALVAPATFPGVSTAGSNSLNLNSTAGISVGDVITGRGIPAGATVLSLTPTSITLSANATLTTTSGNVYCLNGGGIRYETVGTAPNRELIVQWSRFGLENAATGTNLNFQVRLHENLNDVSIVYGPTTIGTLANSHQIHAGVTGNQYECMLLTTMDYAYFTSVDISWDSASFVSMYWEYLLLNTTSRYQPFSGLTYYFDSYVTGIYPPPSINAVDVAMSGLVRPFLQANAPNASQQVKVRIKNVSNSILNFSANPATISGSVTGPNPLTYTPVVINTGTLLIGDSLDVIITNSYNMTAAGNYAFSFSVSVTADGNAANNSLSNVQQQVVLPHTLPFNEGFQSGFYSRGYTLVPSPGAGTWNHASGYPQCLFYCTNPPVDSGTIAFSDYISPQWASNSERFITPPINFTGISSPAIDITMYQSMQPHSESVEIYYSTNNGVTWNSTGAGFSCSNYVSLPDFEDWSLLTAPLGGCANQPNVILAFEGSTMALQIFRGAVIIDHFRIYDSQTDVSPFSMLSPALSLTNAVTETVTVEVKNTGTAPVRLSASSPITISVQVTGASTQNFSLQITSDTLLPGAVHAYTVTTACNLSNAGTHNFRIIATVTGDQNISNDTLYRSVVNTVAPLSLPAQQPFAAVNNNWVISQVTGSGNWTLVNGNLPAAPNSPAPATNYYMNFNSGAHPVGTTSRLRSPLYSFSSATQPALSFYLRADNAGSIFADRVEIRVSTDRGLTWSSPVYTAMRYDVTYTIPAMKQHQVCLSAYANMPEVMIAFDAVSGIGGALKLDDISIAQRAAPAAGTITAVSNQVCTGNSVTLQNSGFTGELQWQTSPTGLPGSWINIAGATASSYTTTALTATAFFQVLATNVCYSPVTSAALQINVNPVPVVNLGADITQCGGTVLLNAQIAGSSYQWNNSTNAQTLTASSSGTYSVTVTDANNCSASDAINVTINPVP